jgi:hypothetical protein
MSKSTFVEASETAVMEPTITGTYVERTVKSALWRCEGCGLVWEKRWHAETCESRGHKDRFAQGPYGVQRMENGKLVGTLHWYERRAVRRDRVAVSA